MAVIQYQKNGQTLYRVTVKVRSKTDRSLSVQRVRLGLKSEREANAVHRALFNEAAKELASREMDGESWDSVVGQWELYARDHLQDLGYEITTVIDHVALLRNWTTDWLKRPASQIGGGDAEDLISKLAKAGKSAGFQKTLKHTVNVVYDWGVRRKLIPGNPQSPMRGIKLRGPKAEKVPDILTVDEIRVLLREAQIQGHEWYPIWATALLTGMRNGELHALLWTDVDFENRRITVSKSYHTRGKRVKPTKNGRWRTVPISDELMALLSELKAEAGDRQHVLPRLWKWDQGQQAEVLRTFCLGVGITSVRFHALRACFATQLLANDVAPARVMKICGWEELKTMQRYIRMAGIDEKGATQVLKFLPEAQVMGEVVNLFDFKADRK